MPGRRPGRGRRLAMRVLGWAVKPGGFRPCRRLVFAREMSSALGGQAGIAVNLHSRVERLIGRRGSELTRMMSHGRGGRWAVGVAEGLGAWSHSLRTGGLGPVCRRGAVDMPPRADRLSGRGMMMNRRRDGRRRKRQRTSTVLVRRQVRYHRRPGPVASLRLAFPVALAARETGPARHSALCHCRRDSALTRSR